MQTTCLWLLTAWIHCKGSCGLWILEMELCISAEKTKILAINTSGRSSLQPRDVLLRPVDGLVSVVDGFE